MNRRSDGRALALLFATTLLAGCAGAPSRPSAVPPPAAPEPTVVVPAASPMAEAVVARARSLLGVPYRLGGMDPAAGFDCSGLVYFVYREAGLLLPRTAEAQQVAATPVDRHGLAPGDLVFFRLPQPHVGIYAGGGEFIHAPGSGRGVEVARIGEPWFQLAFAGAGRVGGAEPTAAAAD